MELTLRRARQVLKSIEDRKKVEKYNKDSVTEWCVKTLATFIAGTVDTGKKPNLLLKAVNTIKLKDEKDLQVVEVKGLRSDSAAGSAADIPPEVFVEEGSAVAADRNKPGSFERILYGLKEMPN